LNVLPSSSVITTCQPSLAQTRAFATAISTPILRLCTFSLSRSASIM